MTDDELRAHWGETAPVPPVRKGTDPVVLLVLAGLVLLMLAIVFVPAWISDEPSDEELREIHVCEMTEAMGGASVMEAELLCARGWQK